MRRHRTHRKIRSSQPGAQRRRRVVVARLLPVAAMSCIDNVLILQNKTQQNIEQNSEGRLQRDIISQTQTPLFLHSLYCLLFFPIGVLLEHMPALFKIF